MLAGEDNAMRRNRPVRVRHQDLVVHTAGERMVRPGQKKADLTLVESLLIPTALFNSTGPRRVGIFPVGLPRKFSLAACWGYPPLLRSCGKVGLAYISGHQSD